MKDLDLIGLFSGLLESAIAAEGITDTDVIQLFQPTQQSRADSGDGVYFQLLFTRNYGSAYKTQTYNQDTGVFDTVQIQQMVAKFQISVFYPADPSNVDRLSSNDLATNIAMRMQSDDSIQKLRAAGVGITRITDVRNPQFDNEQDQSEFVPNFDMDLNYNREIDGTVQKIVEFIGTVRSVS
mgnify:CR=1 FL=1